MTKKPVSHNARTLKRLRDQGYMAEVVERWNPHAHKRHDLFGFLDIVACKANMPGVLGVQVTSRSHMADRRTKICEHENLWNFLKGTGNRIEVWGWDKAPGSRMWRLKVERILDDE